MGCDLYRYFNVKNELLYIGISNVAMHRLREHRTSSPWYEEIRTIKIEKHRTRKDALLAEKTAIKDEKPKYNRAHQPNPIPRYLINQTDIARLIRIQNQKVKLLTALPDFPTPVIATIPKRWNAYQVKTWLKANGYSLAAD